MPNVGSARSWVWNAVADMSEGEPEAQTLAIRLADPDRKSHPSQLSIATTNKFHQRPIFSRTPSSRPNKRMRNTSRRKSKAFLAAQATTKIPQVWPRVLHESPAMSNRYVYHHHYPFLTPSQREPITNRYNSVPSAPNMSVSGVRTQQPGSWNWNVLHMDDLERFPLCS